MAAQRRPKRKQLSAKPDKETTVATEKTKVETKTALPPVKVKERARLKSEEAPAEAQKALRAVQGDKHERQARIKAKKALAEAQEALTAARREVEQEHQAGVRRVSFVVRLTVDERGQPRRTEIEHVESSRKQNFLSLDGERLVAFMKACISPAIVLEHGIPAAPLPESIKAPAPEPLRPAASLIVSDVRVLHLRNPDVMALTLSPEEAFVVQTRFQLQSFEAPSLTAQESSYEMKVYANEVTSGKSKLLTTYSAKLIQDALEYTASVEAPGLPPGLYRLFTLVTLGAPIKMAGYYNEPVIQVI